jgi:hypothetical protein
MGFIASGPFKPGFSWVPLDAKLRGYPPDWMHLERYAREYLKSIEKYGGPPKGEL